MLVETHHIRPSDDVNGWEDLKAGLKDASMAAVLLDDTVDWSTLKGVAMVVALSRVPVVAAFGKRSEEFHDLVDFISLSDREFVGSGRWSSRR
jgi:hypothetical protein